MKTKKQLLALMMIMLMLAMAVPLMIATPALAIIGPVQNIDTGESFATIQAAIDDSDTLNGHTIEVATGIYAGATVNKGVTITVKAGDTVTINDGPNSHSYLRAGFLFPDDYSGNGATISGFHFAGVAQTDTVDDGNLDFPVFSRGANNVTVADNIMNNSLQAITNWHGSGWQITGNQIVGLWTLNGGGIGILIGANNGSTVQDNVVSGNDIGGVLSVCPSDGGGYDGTGVVLFTDFRWGRAGGIATLNSIIGNAISMVSDTPGVVNFNGIELTNTSEDDPPPLTIYDNTVSDNSIMGNSGDGIAVSTGIGANLIINNCIVGNQGYGLSYTGTPLLDAELNWWGDAGGPGVNGANGVNGNVDYDPWLSEPTACVPEVTTIILLSLGLLGLGAFVWFKRRKAGAEV